MSYTVRPPHLFTLVLAIALGFLGAVPQFGQAQDAPTAFPKKVVCGHIENCFEVTPGLFSGGSPETEADFAALAKLGVTHLISVDGKPPLLDLAKKHNLKYIHLPIGYGQLANKTMAQIAAAMPESPETKVFIHCHHGKHRGPAAAAIACQYSKGLSSDQALAWLKVAGTSPDYPGLFDAVRTFPTIQKADVEKFRGSFVDAVLPPPLVESMLTIDEQFDAISAAVKTNTPESLAKARTTAVLLKESLTELGREKHTSKADLFAKHLAESLDATKQLEASLKPGSAENPAKILGLVKGTCAKCHHETRDLP